MAELRRRDSLSARALEYTVLTAARTNDTVGADWEEIDRQERAWIVPAARLKGRRGRRKRDHYVPLSDPALEILDKLLQGTAHLFAHEDGEPLSNWPVSRSISKDYSQGPANPSRSAAGLQKACRNACFPTAMSRPIPITVSRSPDISSNVFRVNHMPPISSGISSIRSA